MFEKFRRMIIRINCKRGKHEWIWHKWKPDMDKHFGCRPCPSHCKHCDADFDPRMSRRKDEG